MPDMAVARLCSSCGAAEPTVDSWVSSWAPGFAGAGAGTGSAAAVALSASAVETAPTAAIMVETSSFLVRFMVLPIVGGEGLKPKLRELLELLK